MKVTSIHIIRVYVALMGLSTLAASFIWGVNTIFLLDAGLSNTQAFLANSFYTIGQVFFELPTGIVADVKGRRLSFLLAASTLAISTLLYLAAWQYRAPFIAWAVSSILLGLGFTFFSGATEAWLVDALKFANYTGSLEAVFAKGQIVSGIAMLVGSVSGGVIAQYTSLAAPYIIRTLLLVVTFIIAFVYMHDWGFSPAKSTHVTKDVQDLLRAAGEIGFRKPSVRWLLFAVPATNGVGLFAFYAMQPYLLKLYGDEKAFAVAGAAAAIVALSQVFGGTLVPKVLPLFRYRTSLMMTGGAISVLALILFGITTNFWVAIAILCIWALASSVVLPVRQAYFNGLIPSKQRATLLSLDSLMGSLGGVIVQPVLGKIADLSGYDKSFVAAGIGDAFSLPFLWLARQEKEGSDVIE